MALSEDTKQKLIEIAENIPKVYENGAASGGGNSPKDVIYLTNDIRIESRENGLWIVDGEEELHIYDNKWQQLQAQYADYANEADRAFYDAEGRELKGTTVYEYYDSYAYVVLENGTALSYGVVDNISVELPEDYYIGFTSSVYFTTPSYVGGDFVDSDGVYYKGDDTDGGTFNPKTDTRYTLKFEYNGERFIATVSGVPANI